MKHRLKGSSSKVEQKSWLMLAAIHMQYVIYAGLSSCGPSVLASWIVSRLPSHQGAILVRNSKAACTRLLRVSARSLLLMQ